MGWIHKDKNKIIWRYKKYKFSRQTKIPKENTQYTRLSVILLDSVIQVGKRYYPQTLLDKSNDKSDDESSNEKNK